MPISDHWSTPIRWLRRSVWALAPPIEHPHFGTVKHRNSSENNRCHSLLPQEEVLKRKIAAAAALATVLSAAACSSSSSSGSSSQGTLSTDGKGKTITVWIMQ